MRSTTYQDEGFEEKGPSLIFDGDLGEGGRMKLDNCEMMVDKSRTFQYIKIESNGRRYFCVQQSLIDVIWVLYFEENPSRPTITPDSTPTRLGFVLGWLRQQFGDIRMNLKSLMKFVFHKYQLKSIDGVICLSYYGQTCMPVHKGYKIFDLRRGMVLKVFDQDISTSLILSEIEQLRLVSKIDFAPSIGRWNIQDRWYEENYVNGSMDSSHLLMDSATLLKKFRGEVVQHMKDLVLFQKPITKNAIDYVNDISSILEVSGMSKREESMKEFREIKTFIDSVVERLHGAGNYPIQVVFAHSDFVPANMMQTSKGMKLVDWEEAKYRSALFDFYSYFFFRPVWLKTGVKELTREIQEALSIFISSIATESPEVSKSLLSLENDYRWIFYIDLLCRQMKREMTDTRLDIRSIIFQYMGTFNRYEEELALNSEGKT